MTSKTKPKRLELTNRDLHLMRTISSYGILTTKQLVEKIFRGVASTTVLRRLRALEAAGYIQRIVGLDSFERCWFLTEKSKSKFGFAACKLHFPKAIIDHDVKLSTLRLKLEEHEISESWIPEHEIRSKVARTHGLREASRKVIPDAIMGVDYLDFKRSVAIEVELSIKNQKRYQEIFWDYEQKQTLMAVWYLVPNQSFVRQLLKARRNAHIMSRGPDLLFSEIDDVLTNGGKALVSDGRLSAEIERLWKPKTTIVPAHPGAQQVSGGSLEKSPLEIALTTENTGKLLLHTG
ncbi:MAG: hypothetical protein EOP06_04655 [Proteobacteria bacterium]|nr:MAG: hypothetical protein EOP06_04655 [Pseudomonadota bacterium]